MVRDDAQRGKDVNMVRSPTAEEARALQHGKRRSNVPSASSQRRARSCGARVSSVG